MFGLEGDKIQKLSNFCFPRLYGSPCIPSGRQTRKTTTTTTTTRVIVFKNHPKETGGKKKGGLGGDCTVVPLLLRCRGNS